MGASNIVDRINGCQGSRNYKLQFFFHGNQVLVYFTVQRNFWLNLKANVKIALAYLKFPSNLVDNFGFIVNI